MAWGISTAGSPYLKTTHSAAIQRSDNVEKVILIIELWSSGRCNNPVIAIRRLGNWITLRVVAASHGHCNLPCRLPTSKINKEAGREGSKSLQQVSFTVFSPENPSTHTWRFLLYVRVCRTSPPPHTHTLHSACMQALCNSNCKVLDTLHS